MPIRADLRKFYGATWRLIVRPRILLRAGGQFGPLRTAYFCLACGGLIGLRSYLPHRTPDRTLCKVGGPLIGTFPVAGEYRGGARCEQCAKPNRQMLDVRSGRAEGVPVMIWRRAQGWAWNDFARAGGAGILRSFDLLSRLGPMRRVETVLTVAHLNHTPGDDRDENLLALCHWCHLNYDWRHHKETRATRKDAARPLLQGVA